MTTSIKLGKDEILISEIIGYGAVREGAPDADPTTIKLQLTGEREVNLTAFTPEERKKLKEQYDLLCKHFHPKTPELTDPSSDQKTS